MSASSTAEDLQSVVESLPLARARASRVHVWTSLGIAVAVLTLACVPSFIKLIYYPDYPGSDDAFIHLAIVKNLREGLGWGINPNQHSNLSSSPLFDLSMWAITALGAEDIGGGKSLSALCAIGMLILVFLTARRLSASLGFAFLALGFAAFNVHLWRWNGTVMETTMACLLLMLFYHQHCGLERGGLRHALKLGFLAGLASLCRFECMLCVPLVIVEWHIWQRVKRQSITMAFLAGFGSLLLPWMAFSKLYFGSFLPTTFHAKAGGLYFFNATVLRQLASVVFSAYGFALVFIVLAILLLIKHRDKNLSNSLEACFVPLGFSLLLAAFYYFKTASLQSAARYYTLGLVSVPLMVAALAPCARIAQRKVMTIGVAALTLHVASTIYLNQSRVAPVLSSFSSNYWSAARDASSFLRSRPAKSTVLIEVDIGMLSYYGDHAYQIVDGGGLASPEMQGLDLRSRISRVKPQFVVETLGPSSFHLASQYPELKPLWSRSFRSHSVGFPGDTYYLNVYQERN